MSARAARLILPLLQVDMVGVEGEVEREHARHREHLERNVGALKRKMADEAKVHGADNVKIMQVTRSVQTRQSHQWMKRAGREPSWAGLLIDWMIDWMIDWLRRRT